MKRLAANLVIILALGLIFWPLEFSRAATEAEANYPRLANYFLHWEITDDTARALAKWDLLVLDMEVAKTSPEQLALIRSLNPQIKILAYISSQEIMNDPSFLPVTSLRHELLSNIYPGWWLKASDGRSVSFWPGTAMLNLSDGAVSSESGQKFNDYLPDFVNQHIKASGLWDGVFYDNLWGNICWLNSGDLDLDNDTARSDCSSLNQAWSNGVVKMLAQSRALFGGDFLIAANGQFYPLYFPYLNGLMFEEFPASWENNGSWTTSASHYFTADQQISRRPLLNILNRRLDGAADYGSFRFGLANALLADAYYSADKGTTDHGQTWWFDEYDVDLGPARSRAYNIWNRNATSSPGLWRRDFANGIALLNSSATDQKIIFSKEELEKIKGRQDPKTNDGSKLTWLKLSPGQGIVLLKSGAEILNSNFNNGNFVRVYDERGESVKNGFFAYLPSFAGDQEVISFMEGKGNKNIVSQGRSLEIYQQGKLAKAFFPFGRTLNFSAFTAVNQQLVVARPGQVRTFNEVGKLLGVFPIKSQGTVSLAADADHIAIASRDPYIRVYDFRGHLLKEFLAYGEKWTGGINLALGDVNADGQTEIVSAPQAGGGPQVRIFSLDGRLLGQFLAFDKSFTKGVKPSLTDINHDGRLEILIGIKNF